MQGVPNHKGYTQRLVILHRDSDTHVLQFPVKNWAYPPPENPTRAPSDIPQNTPDICPAKNSPQMTAVHHSLFCIVTAVYSFQY